MLQMVTLSYSWLHWVTGGYTELQMVTLGYRWLHCVTDGYTVLLVVTLGCCASGYTGLLCC